MNKLIITGEQEFLGKYIPVIEGGFGEGKKCLTDKTIAEIHHMEVKHVRELINRNAKRFKDGMDLIDLKVVVENDHNSYLLKNLDFTQMQISKAKHIYLLSERGYAKLIKIMDNDLAWAIHDRLIDEYFTMRQSKQSDEQKKKELVYKLFLGGIDSVQAHKLLVELEVEEVTVPLIEEIEEKSTIIDRVISDDQLFALDLVGKMLKPYSTEFGANKIFAYMRNQGILMDDEGTHRYNLPYDKYSQYFELKAVDKATRFGYRTYTKCYFTGHGLKWFLTRLVKANVITASQKETTMNQI